LRNIFLLKEKYRSSQYQGGQIYSHLENVTIFLFRVISAIFAANDRKNCAIPSPPGVPDKPPTQSDTVTPLGGCSLYQGIC